VGRGRKPTFYILLVVRSVFLRFSGEKEGGVQGRFLTLGDPKLCKMAESGHISLLRPWMARHLVALQIGWRGVGLGIRSCLL